MDDTVARIRTKLAAACTEPVPRPRTFVRAPGGRRLGTPLSEERVAAYEARHGVRLPRSYRTFLREIGNGGIGPHYGLLPLTRWYVQDIPAPTDRLGSVFALEPTDSLATDWARLRDVQNNHPYAGTLTVVDRGCLEVTLLVISGPARGGSSTPTSETWPLLRPSIPSQTSSPGTRAGSTHCRRARSSPTSATNGSAATRNSSTPWPTPVPPANGRLPPTAWAGGSLLLIAPGMCWSMPWPRTPTGE